jgi:hypothetical protein
MVAGRRTEGGVLRSYDVLSSGHNPATRTVSALSRDMNSMSSQEWRDLIWAVNSPSLLADGSCSLATAEAVDWSLVDPDEVVTFVRQEPTHRVGRYFERLLYFYLSRVRQTDIIASGLQIRDDSRTIGELDFVFQDEESRGPGRRPGSLLTHWESTAKFYLWCPNRTVEGSHLIGPNAADTFERKMNRLLQHQLPLGQTQLAAEELQKARAACEFSTAVAGVGRVQGQAFVRGRIFYPAEFDGIRSDLTECAHPEQLSSNHLRGIWIRASQLEVLEGLPFDWFAFVEKPYWLAPPARFDLSAVMVIGQLRSHFRRSRFPRLLACCRCPELSGDADTRHVFVMSDDWPAAASE